MDITILWAFLLDLILGDPRRPTHPVILIGHLIGFLEKKFRRIFDKPRDLKRAGVVLWLVTIVTVYFITLLSIRVAYKIGLWFGHTVSIWLMYTTLSVRNLADEAMGIFKEIQNGNMVGARKRLAGIVGRDTMDLNISEISRATIETVAENTVDGIISPLFYAFIGGVPLAMTYKAVNTLDSMVGYKNDKYRHIGWCSARMDDFFNFLPARLGGVLMLFSALLLRLDVQRGIRTVLSDAKKHKSPNSGISEAITAGVLGIRLGGWSQYFGVRQFRAYMGEQTRQIVLEDIKKTVALSAIDKNGVTVTFEALEEALEGVVVTVVDPEGNEVEVEAQDLEEGATSATFAFVEALEKDPTTGVWTVNGEEYDFDERAAVKAVKDATNLVELWDALESDYFEGATQDNIEAYRDADRSELVTAEDVNKMIADVNDSLVDAETEAAIVAAIKKVRTNELQLLNALKTNDFKAVNDKLIMTYKDAIGELTWAEDNEEETVTVKYIQDAIYEANEEAAEAAYDKAFKSLKAEDVAAARVAAGYLEDAEFATDAGITKQEFANDHLDLLDALIAVNDAETDSALKSALVALDKLDADLVEKYEDVTGHFDEEGFDIETVKDEYLNDYMDAIKEAKIKEKNQRSDIQAIIGVVNQAAEEAAQAINEKITIGQGARYSIIGESPFILGYWAKVEPAEGTSFDEFKSVEIEFFEGKKSLAVLTYKGNFEELPDYLSGTYDMFGDYKSNSWDQVVTGELTERPDKIVATVEFDNGDVAVQVLEGDDVTYAEESTMEPYYVEVVNRAETIDEMAAALTNLAVIVEGQEGFINLSSAAKKEIAELVLEARDEQEGISGHPSTKGKFFGTTTLMKANDLFDNIVKVDAYKNFISDVNEIENIADMRVKLANDYLPEFKKLSPAVQAEKAELVLNALNALKADEKDGFKTLTEIKAAAEL